MRTRARASTASLSSSALIVLQGYLGIRLRTGFLDGRTAQAVRALGVCLACVLVGDRRRCDAPSRHGHDERSEAAANGVTPSTCSDQALCPRLAVHERATEQQLDRLTSVSGVFTIRPRVKQVVLTKGELVGVPCPCDSLSWSPSRRAPS